MTSPPSQPSIADAARLMDSLSFATSSRPTLPDTSTSSALSMTAASDDSSTPLDLGIYSKGARDEPLSVPPPPNDAASASSSRNRVPSLPAEIILIIATYLVSTFSSPLHSATDIRPPTFPCIHSFPPYSALSPSSSDLTALLSLASASRSFRNTLIPLVWHTIVIRTPQHLPRLAALLSSYDTLSVRSSSPERRRTSSPAGTGLRHPLPHIRSIVVSIPDKYMDLDQSYLLNLLRSMDLQRTQQVEHLYWSAEAVPIPSLWPLLAPSLRSLELDGRTFYQGHRGMAGLERLESLRMVGYESTLLPRGVVAVFRAQEGEEREEREEVSELPEGVEEDERRNRGWSPVVELQSVVQDGMRQARHLYLDPSQPPPTSTAPIPPVPKRTHLTHLSLSTSKTSLFHQSLTFAGLTHLDLYPITPEPPLSSALLSTASTLTHLRLVLDISGAFANYNRLWSDLTGNLPELVWLEIDPMPQQNTAPSFWDFVEQAAKLKWINGKDVESFPPCFGAFDPTHPSGALPY